MKKDVIKKDVSKYNLSITNFEGPLDLLVYLISKNKMDIFDISLSELTDKYIEYLNEMTKLNLEITSEFIVMASALLNIKSRKLLPELKDDESEDDQITEEAMILRIVEYKKYKELAQKITQMYNQNFGCFEKIPEKIDFKTSKKELNYNSIDINRIHNIYMDIVEKNKNKINIKANDIKKLALYDKYTVKDKVEQIVSYLNDNNNMVFNKLYNTSNCPNIEVVTAFLGILELTKLKQVNVNQDALFSDIYVNKNSKYKINTEDFINEKNFKNLYKNT